MRKNREKRKETYTNDKKHKLLGSYPLSYHFSRIGKALVVGLERETEATLERYLPGLGFVGGMDIGAAVVGVAIDLNLAVVIGDEVMERRDEAQPEPPDPAGQTETGVG